jgi:hypothetical protein
MSTITLSTIPTWNGDQIISYQVSHHVMVRPAGQELAQWVKTLRSLDLPVKPDATLYGMKSDRAITRTFSLEKIPMVSFAGYHMFEEHLWTLTHVRFAFAVNAPKMMCLDELWHDKASAHPDVWATFSDKTDDDTLIKQRLVELSQGFITWMENSAVVNLVIPTTIWRLK